MGATYSYPPYEGWRTHAWIILIMAEIVSVLCVIRLWRRVDSKSVVQKVCESLFLLVPIIGPLLYFFVRVTPTRHYNDTGG